MSKQQHSLKMKPDDDVTIQIECDGRPPINIKVELAENGRRYVNVRVFDGRCGTVADPPLDRLAQLTTKAVCDNCGEPRDAHSPQPPHKSYDPKCGGFYRFVSSEILAGE